MIDPKKNPKAKVPDVIKPHIKPDAPNTQPGDVGNGHVLVLNERQQKFNGTVYKRQTDGNYTCKINKQKYWLHIDVWNHHNGEAHPANGLDVHHDARRSDGTFDKNENNIEHLLLMTRSAHMAYHTEHRPLVERVCQHCGKRFWTNINNKRYCSDKCRTDHPQTLRQRLCTCVVCGKIFSARRNNPAMTCSDECAQVVANVEMPALHPSDKTDFEPKVIRVCPICGQQFIAQTTNPAITCSNACGNVGARIKMAKKRMLQEHIARTGSVPDTERLLDSLDDDERMMVFKLVVECHNGNVDAAHRIVDEFIHRRLKDKI